MKRKLLLFGSLFFLTVSAAAQKNEVAVFAGGYWPIDSSLRTSSGTHFGGAVAHRVASVPFVSVYLELPVIGAWNMGASNRINSVNYSSLFITPGVKLKLAPSSPVSPYFIADVGYARYNASNSVLGSSSSNVLGSSSSNNVVGGVGGGVDVKIFFHLSLRAEVRDYHTSDFSLLNVRGISGHNLLAGGGVVLRF